MDFIFELLFEIILEGSIEIIEEKKVSLIVRILCAFLLVVIYGGLIGILLFVAISKQSVLMLFVTGVVALAIMFAFAYKYICRYKSQGVEDFKMSQKYKVGFDVWGLSIFLIIMIPNFIWFAVPAPNDVLRAESITKVADIIASVCQVLMIMSLCIFINRDRKKLSITRLIIAAILCCLLYFLCWILYYMGVTNALVILGLTIFPCMAFLFFAIDRKNMIAVIPILVFTICHAIYGVMNYIV